MTKEELKNIETSIERFNRYSEQVVFRDFVKSVFWFIAVFAAIALLAVLCGGCEPECPLTGGRNTTDYVDDYRVDYVTQDGISVMDDSGTYIDNGVIDATVTAFEECIGRIDSGILLDTRIDRDCLKVYIVDDAYTVDLGDEVFPCRCHPRESEYDCECYGVIEDQQILVITPNMSALAHELAHYVLVDAYDDDPFSDFVTGCTEMEPKEDN